MGQSNNYVLLSRKRRRATRLARNDMKLSGYLTEVLASMAVILAFPALAQLPSRPIQDTINWSIGNSTGADQTNCPDQYVATEARCLAEGGRACLMQRAIASAKANNCSYAMRLTLITQCHNANAQQQLGAAGEAEVCTYLRTK